MANPSPNKTYAKNSVNAWKQEIPITRITPEIPNSKFLECLRQLILRNEIQEPIVFHKLHEYWGPCQWNLGDWGEIFRDQKLSVRYGKQNWNHDHPQWESLCENIEITWTKLIEWVREEHTLPIRDSSPNDIWMYYDYKHLPEVMYSSSEVEKDFLKVIYLSENLKKKFCWSSLGFPERNGDHSTLWVGTAGSYTNTHYDTYSSNLVCQVYGRKTWLVFPPCDTEHLRPTRIPYEESSVYSQMNFASKKQILKNILNIKKCSPRKITLEPGDCLYLPPKWWHFVKSEELSISVNTWIELPCDHFTRVEEAVLRSAVSCAVNSPIPCTTKTILNPNEMYLTESNDQSTENTLKAAASAYLHYEQTVKEDLDENSDGEPNDKKLKLSSEEHSFEKLVEYAPSSVTVEYMPLHNLEAEAATSEQAGEGLATCISKDEVFPKRSPTYLEDFLNAVGHPDVLKQIAIQFLNNVKDRSSN